MYRNDNGFDDRQWKKFCVATAIDVLNSVLRCAQQATLIHQEPDQIRDDLEKCLKFLDQSLHGDSHYVTADHQDDEILRKYAEFLELACEALQRGPDILGKPQWEIVIQLGNAILYSKGLPIIGYGPMKKVSQKAYQKIQSTLGDEGFLKPLIRLELLDNPADPPNVEVVQGNAGTSDTGVDRNP
ncbi:hypothetical protein FS837_000942 [Tulasnella sp. UAMH 9824]|nr:hypothetical protein FS837_000942 [Tulasnella sp. UAMH 9824]